MFASFTFDLVAACKFDAALSTIVSVVMEILFQYLFAPLLNLYLILTTTSSPLKTNRKRGFQANLNAILLCAVNGLLG